MTPEQIQSLESAGFRVADAADFLGLTPAEAAQVDENVNAINLTPRDGARLAAALDDPPAPSPALMRAAERHDRLIGAPAMTYKVLLTPDIDSGRDAVLVDLPFPPFYGLFIRLPWRGMDYCKIDHICWDEKDEAFHVFFCEDGYRNQDAKRQAEAGTKAPKVRKRAKKS